MGQVQREASEGTHPSLVPDLCLGSGQGVIDSSPRGRGQRPQLLVTVAPAPVGHRLHAAGGPGASKESHPVSSQDP